MDAIRSDMIVRDLPEQAILVTADGKKIHIRGTASPLKDENNQFKGVIFTFSPDKTSKYPGFFQQSNNSGIFVLFEKLDTKI